MKPKLVPAQAAARRYEWTMHRSLKFMFFEPRAEEIKTKLNFFTTRDDDDIGAIVNERLSDDQANIVTTASADSVILSLQHYFTE